MARCGCAASEKCNCVFKDGTCTKVNVTAIDSGGCASPTFKFSVDIIVDNNTVTCGANGLEAILHTLDTNTVDLEGAGTAVSPLEAHVIRTPDGNVPDPDTLGTGNLLKELPGPGGGIYVSCEDIQDCVGAAIDVITADCLDYDDTINTISIKICTEPNGIECAPAGSPGCAAGGLLVTPSSDPNNTLTFGTDNRLFAPAASIQPGDCMTFTGSGTQADPFVISPQIAPELNGVECVPGQGLLVTPSADPGNFLVFGGDTRLFVNRCPLTSAGSQVLVGNTGPCFDVTGGADCVTPIQATLRLSDDVCQGLVCRPDGLFVQNDTTAIPATVQVVQNFGPFGPFNGTIPLTPPAGNNRIGILLVGPICITITNPSPCRDLVVNSLLNGFAETGRTGGRFRMDWQVSESGNLAGPWFAISQMGQSSGPGGAGNVPTRMVQNASFTGNDFPLGPGASRTECLRLGFNSADPGRPVVNGRVFSGQLDFSIKGRWAQ